MPYVNVASWTEELLQFQQKLERGWANLARHARPSYAETPRELIFEQDGMRLWRFRGSEAPAGRPPLLIVYALVNTVWMTDLQVDRSLVRNLLAAGEDVYLIEWGFPVAIDRWLQLEDYIELRLGRCVDEVSERHGGVPIHLLGICQGGVFALCYAALRPQRIARLVTMVTPVDFHTPDNMLGMWARHVDVDRLVAGGGNIPSALINSVYLNLKPLRLHQQKYVDLVDLLDNPDRLENFMRMERWIFESPDLAGEAFRQFIRKFYQHNGLVAGGLEIGGKPVELVRITAPVFNIFAAQDHLVPPSAAQALRGRTGGSYQEWMFQGGHIGIYVSARAQREVAPKISAWLASDAL
ncbi:class III poly(R)-hydroxyalkanoic acid synthase subunit PhaC [Frateuria aurantia]